MSLVSFTATVLATLQFTFLLSPGILSPWCHCLSVLIPDLPPRSVRPMLPVSALTSVECGPSAKVLGHQRIPAFRDEDFGYTHTAPSSRCKAGWATSFTPCSKSARLQPPLGPSPLIRHVYMCRTTMIFFSKVSSAAMKG